MAGMKAVPLKRFNAVLDSLPPKYAAIAAIGVTTGCRISEVLSLRRFDLLERDGTLKDKIALLKLKTRGNGVLHRFLSIPADYREYVLDHLRQEEERGYDRPDAFVFRGKQGRHLSRRTVWAFFRSCLGARHGTHWMRKTFAQEMFKGFLRQTPDDPMRALELTRRALGHARLDTTVRYLGIDSEKIDAVQQQIFRRGNS